jgi:hypothetical protein
MNESKASRTLLKSPPELWSEVSSATSLQRHLDPFGEIRITKLEPETAVAWEGEHARGTITLEVSGWGTRVSLTAEAVSTGGAYEPAPEAAGQPDNEPADRLEPEPAALAEPEPVALAQPAAVVEPEPAALAEPGAFVEPEPAALAQPGGLVEPEPRGERVEPEPAENLDRPRETEVETPDPTISLERNPLDASRQKPRWAQRVARALRRWFSSAPQEDTDSIIRPAAVPAPAPPTTFLPAPAPAPAPNPPIAAASTSERAPVVPEPERPAVPPSPILAPDAKAAQKPSSQLDDAPAAALDAALDSLGQAHHRPFSRA